MDRTPKQILAEWRECERAYEGAPAPEIARRIEALRTEHATAIADRQVQADELAELAAWTSP